MFFLDGNSLRCRSGEVIRQEQGEERCGVHRSSLATPRAPAGRQPEGPRSFAPWVRRRARPYSLIRPSPFSCPRRKIPAAQAIPP